MKKSIFSLFITSCIVALVAACSAPAPQGAQPFTIQGEFTGLDNTSGYVSVFSVDEADSIGVIFADGRYMISDSIEHATVLRVGGDKSSELFKMVGRGYIPSKTPFMWVVAIPGEDVIVNASSNGKYMSTTSTEKENAALAAINAATFPLSNEALDLSVEYYVNEELTPEEKDAIRAKAEELSTKAIAVQKEFIENNPSSYAALYYIDDMLIRRQIEPEEIEAILANVSEEYHSHPYYTRLVQKVEGAKATVVGGTAPNIISTQTVDGSTFDMSTITDKYIIIDFWGTWCGPCMSGMPHLKEYKEKYADKLEVVAVAKDSKDKWLAAAQDGSMPWIHILNGTDNEDYISQYNVQGYPTKLILAPSTREILFRATGESDEFYAKLDELLN
ncbi:MAG: TlpA disulfide reductase family protein [Rikenellaceae bacterium]